MEEEEFARLAERYHALARHDPRRYRRRVTALAALGYGYVAGVLPLLVVGSVALAMLLERIHAGFLGAKLVMLQVALAWAVARSLWVRFAPGKGIDVTPAEAPRLFETIDEVRAAIRARPVK